MRRIRVLHTESFRLAAWFATLFLALAGILLVTIYWIVRDSETAALVASIDADIRTIENGYRGKGLPEAIEVVHQRLGSPEYSGGDLPGGYILIQDGSGRLAGNLAPRAPQLGLLSLPNPRTGLAGGAHAVLGKGVFLAPGVYLYVGRDTATMAAARTRILQAFAWIAAATIVLAALGGVLFSMQFLRRVDAIARTCRAIVAGQVNDRIPVRGSDDELDRLSGAINGMLDRIAALLDNLRQVSSDVAHDLRTPLTHLRQRLESARLKSTTVDEYSVAVARAIDDTDQLLAMFSALLRISQVEAGTRLAGFSEVSLTDLMNRMYEMFRPVAEDQGQRLERAIEADVRVRGDAELLAQLFSNLVENAIRHTPQGTSIRISLTAANGCAVARVCDDGPGIPVAERDKVVRRFYRVATSRSTPGHGLGLALVVAIANLHQGKVELSDNQPGLCVSLSLPATVAACRS